VSFGQRLGEVGYHTATIGKMHLTPWYDNFGFNGRIIAEAKAHVECPDDYERFLNKHGTSRKELYDTKDPEFIHNIKAKKFPFSQELHIDSFIGQSICEYVRRVREPFCLFASFNSPHEPFDPPEPYDTLFSDVDFSARNMTEGEVSRKPSEAYDYINNRLGWPFKTDELTGEQLQMMKSHYYATCTLIDDWVGRIMEVLKETGLYDNTIIIYTSDHGEMLGDHGLIYKQCFYEQSVKVPMIVHAPSLYEPKSVDGLIESIDLFDTLCEVGGTLPGEGSQGRSLVPLLEGESESHREAAFSENWFGRMVRSEAYKMVYYPGKPYGELYNLEEDPLEQHNLWDSAEHESEKRRLKDMLLDWSFDSEDPLPLPVRPGHQDKSPRAYRLKKGDTEECPVQPWYLKDMLDLYTHWNFTDSGSLR
jgi:arylsulfatase A-like enzyme